MSLMRTPVCRRSSVFSASRPIIWFMAADHEGNGHHAKSRSKIGKRVFMMRRGVGGAPAMLWKQAPARLPPLAST